jgi:signal recognition particle subunit SRP72
MADQLSKLLRQTHISSHDDLLAAAIVALKTNKTDLTAHHTRVVSLLNLDRFEDAVRAFDEAGSNFKERARLEYAYALYKSGHLVKAESEARSGSPNERGLQHVLAQTAYRLEKFDEAAKVYETLSQPSPAARIEQNDLRINSGATDAQLEWKGLSHTVKSHRKKPRREDLEAFESCYNAACASIARGELGQSEVLLRRARDLCNASEDLTEEEKKAETLPIFVQQAYVLSRLGRVDEAKRLLEGIDVNEYVNENRSKPTNILKCYRIPDISTRRLANVNLLAYAGTPSNPYLAHRQFHTSTALPKNDLPFEYQNSILRQDEYVMDLLALKYPGVAKSTLETLSKSPSPTSSSTVNSLSVLNAAAHAKSTIGKEGLKAILPYLDQRPNDVGLLFTIIQLYVLTNNLGSAINLIEKFLTRLENSTSPADADVRYAPGLVGTLVSLYAAQSRKTHIRIELAKAAKYWRSKTKDDPDAPVRASLLKAAGTALLESTKTEDLALAGQIFQTLHSHDSSDKHSTAGLIASLSLTSPNSIQTSLLDALPPSSRLVAGIDAEELENAGVARPTQTSTPSSKKRPAAGEASMRKKKKKITKSRMPKDFEEGKKMDPERWLPIRDRSYWRPKGKKGKRAQAGLTQGGIVEEEKPAAAKLAEQPVQPKQGGGGGGQPKGKKKKGKGGKW